MEYKDYYETLGVPRTATQDEIKQAFRKLARKYHPDVSKAEGAEAKFKDLNEANEVLKDPEKRAAYDRMGSNWKAGQEFQPPPGWDAGFEFRGGEGAGFSGGGSPFGGGEGFDTSDFFEQLFGQRARGGGAGGQRRGGRSHGEDSHAKVMVSLEDAYRGAERTITLRAPKVGADGRIAYEERRLDVHIPRGIRAGQNLRLSGQGSAGIGGGTPGDLYLEIAFEPHGRYRLDGSNPADVSFDLRVAPWEAALGATVDAETPDGTVELTIPKGSQAGRKLRLKGRGLPTAKANGTPGDLYAVVQIALPTADDDRSREAYEAMARVFPRFEPRR